MISSLAIKLALIAAASVLLIAGCIGVYSLIRESGARDAIEAAHQQNQEAGNAADQARSNLDAGCPAGLRFRSATGRCERPPVSGRD